MSCTGTHRIRICTFVCNVLLFLCIAKEWEIVQQFKTISRDAFSQKCCLASLKTWMRPSWNAILKLSESIYDTSAQNIFCSIVVSCLIIFKFHSKKHQQQQPNELILYYFDDVQNCLTSNTMFSLEIAWNNIRIDGSFVLWVCFFFAFNWVPNEKLIVVNVKWKTRAVGHYGFGAKNIIQKLMFWVMRCVFV